MDKNIKKYRQIHQKCKWCKYYRYRSPSTKIMGLNCADYEECVLKDKIIHFTNKSNSCLYYTLKEDKYEI